MPGNCGLLLFLLLLFFLLPWDPEGLAQPSPSPPGPRQPDDSPAWAPRPPPHRAPSTPLVMPGLGGSRRPPGMDWVETPPPPTPLSQQRVQDDPQDGASRPRMGNWCPFQKSRLVTFIASCKTEKFLVHSQMPCPAGTSDCQRVMYRLSVKPIYQIKQKVLVSLDWRCCPGYTGQDCQHYDPSLIPVSANRAEGTEEEKHGEDSAEHIAVTRPGASAVLRRAVSSQEKHRGDLQNDIQQATGHLLDLQDQLEYNLTRMTASAHQTQSEGADPPLRPGLAAHLQALLRDHLAPVWSSYNQSLQALARVLSNLTRDVEANRRGLEGFRETAEPRPDLQELGAKFEAKVQESAARADQLRRDLEGRLQGRQTALHRDLVTFETDHDLRLKRLQKTQQLLLLPMNHSMAEVRRGQALLQDQLQQLWTNLSALSAAAGDRGREALRALEGLNATLAGHTEQIQELYTESDETFEQITQLERQLRDLQAQNKATLEEIRVILMEKSLIAEENKEDLERQILELNFTLGQLQGSHWDLLKYLKACNCQKLSWDLDMVQEQQQNATRLLEESQLSLDEQARLGRSSLQALRAAVEDLALALDDQREQAARGVVQTSRLRSQVQALAGDVGSLRQTERHVLAEIRRLNGSFGALLNDALRHETVLGVLLGEDVMEELSEEEAGALPMTYNDITAALRDAHDQLRERDARLDALEERLRILEVGSAQSTPPPGPAGGPQETPEIPRPSLDASVEGPPGDPVGRVVRRLEEETKHLAAELRRLESDWADGRACDNCSGATAGEATERNFQQHLQLFQGLFSNYADLVAANVSLDLAKLHSVLSRKGKKQQRGLDALGKKGKKQKERPEEAGPARRGPGDLEADSPVAFYTGFSEGTDEPGPVRFNETHVNFGQGYIAEHSCFRAPRRGLYMFTVSAAFQPGPSLGHLVLGRQRRTPVGRGPDQAAGGPAFAFALAELQRGERVWFELAHGSLLKHSPAPTTFGGFLLFKT
ncbi:LOW QUALITY PROTEIN: multimerin-2 [Tachyglossus aculeatus]|uniref:LOW QUALITY PROTEIN: multimerin-2 n=1 Tax=Tachyglossus aculeatus TaxID=9261 RepID=UPI0018F6F6E1|nr:LOW QUALITY PROTEIN: multimerin-2 [Tachyglossus aculeatus]